MLFTQTEQRLLKRKSQVWLPLETAVKATYIFQNRYPRLKEAPWCGE